MGRKQLFFLSLLILIGTQTRAQSFDVVKQYRNLQVKEVYRNNRLYQAYSYDSNVVVQTTWPYQHDWFQYVKATYYFGDRDIDSLTTLYKMSTYLWDSIFKTYKSRYDAMGRIIDRWGITSDSTVFEHESFSYVGVSRLIDKYRYENSMNDDDTNSLLVGLQKKHYHRYARKYKRSELTEPGEYHEYNADSTLRRLIKVYSKDNQGETKLSFAHISKMDSNGLEHKRFAYAFTKNGKLGRIPFDRIKLRYRYYTKSKR